MQTAKRRGRPNREPRPGERVGLSLRVTPTTKRQLDAAAVEAGRSLSQEAETRLDNSFRDQGYLDRVLELAYGRQPAALLKMIARAMDDTGRFAGFFAAGTAEGAADWLRNPDAVENVRQGICEILSGFQPEGYEPAVSTLSLPAGIGPAGGLPPLGVGIARGILEAVKNPERGGSIGQWARPIRDQLGDDLADHIRVDNSAVIVPGMRPGPNRQAE